MDDLAKIIDYRGLKYILDKVEDDRVHWTCIYSKFKDHCSIEAWKASNPYGGH